MVINNHDTEECANAPVPKAIKKLIPASEASRILHPPRLDETTDSLETVWRLGVSGWTNVRGTRG